jgi:hypothetical protein
MPTQSGHSGSPVLAQVKQPDGTFVYEVVALHTHRGRIPGQSEGLLINCFMPNIIKFAVDLLTHHKLQREIIEHYLKFYKKIVDLYFPAHFDKPIESTAD